jgi:hypothetical protein
MYYPVSIKIVFAQQRALQNCVSLGENACSAHTELAISALMKSTHIMKVVVF